MLKKLTLLAAGVALGLALPAAAYAKTFYWISHGSPADPVWTYFLAGAEQWAEDTGNTVNTSFHSGDVPSHQEAVRAAISSIMARLIQGQPSCLASGSRQQTDMPVSQTAFPSASTKPVGLVGLTRSGPLVAAWTGPASKNASSTGLVARSIACIFRLPPK